jgi:hypothetical protein
MAATWKDVWATDHGSDYAADNGARRSCNYGASADSDTL